MTAPRTVPPSPVDDILPVVEDIRQLLGELRVLAQAQKDNDDRPAPHRPA